LRPTPRGGVGRHPGPGGREADGWRLRILNPDGSEAEKSGNGIRIFARWLVDSRRASAPTFAIHTLGGVVPVTVDAQGVTADMGAPTFREDLSTVDVDGQTLSVVALSMGNPHCVVFTHRVDITTLGPLIEHHPAFPNRTNVQFAMPVARDRVTALIWERGAGYTLASGSSACAVFAASRRLGLVDAAVTVDMPGGALAIREDGHGHIWMSGPVEEIARVTLSQDLIARLRALP
jgi:diaminopimelate epimerase